jgi:hypothetical protein
MKIEQELHFTRDDLLPGSRGKFLHEVGPMDFRAELRGMFYYAALVTVSDGQTTCIIKDRKPGFGPKDWRS